MIYKGKIWNTSPRSRDKWAKLQTKHHKSQCKCDMMIFFLVYIFKLWLRLLHLGLLVVKSGAWIFRTFLCVSVSQSGWSSKDESGLWGWPSRHFLRIGGSKNVLINPSSEIFFVGTSAIKSITLLLHHWPWDILHPPDADACWKVWTAAGYLP